MQNAFFFKLYVDSVRVEIHFVYSPQYSWRVGLDDSYKISVYVVKVEGHTYCRN